MNQLSKYKIEDEPFDYEDNENSLQLSQNQNPITNLNTNTNILTNPNASTQTKISPVPAFTPQNQITSEINNISDSNFSNFLANNDDPEINNTTNRNPNTNTNTNYHHVQIIDEDVENFKRRLDIMIKNFRTDTLKDFMSIKRNLLIEQKSVIESEKQKCDALLSSKSDLIEHLKDDLAKTQKMLNDQIIIKEKLTNVLFIQKYNKYTKKLKQDAFNGVLKKYHDNKKLKKSNEKKIKSNYHLRLKEFVFSSLKKNWKEMKIYNAVSAREKELTDKMNEMAQYYNKEISDLRNKLNEANIMIERTKESKNSIQENLKKVLMRGVMAMNMEAMNVLDKDMISKQNNNNKQNTQIEVFQSFQPVNIDTQTQGENQIENQVLQMNPVAKDSNWVNASSVPSNMKNNILSNTGGGNRMIMNQSDEFNMEINDIERTEENEFVDEMDNRPYTVQPMGPVENVFRNNISGSFGKDIQPIKQQIQNNNSSSYYDEMQKSKI